MRMTMDTMFLSVRCRWEDQSKGRAEDREDLAPTRRIAHNILDVAYKPQKKARKSNLGHILKWYCFCFVPWLNMLFWKGPGVIFAKHSQRPCFASCNNGYIGSLDKPSSYFSQKNILYFQTKDCLTRGNYNFCHVWSFQLSRIWVFSCNSSFSFYPCA